MLKLRINPVALRVADIEPMPPFGRERVNRWR